MPISFSGDLCFRSGDILVSDEYGYLYFKVSKVWRQVSCEIPVLLFYFSSFCGFEGLVAFGLIIKYLFPNQGLHFFRGCEYESKLKSGIRIRASRFSTTSFFENATHLLLTSIICLILYGTCLGKKCKILLLLDHFSRFQKTC